MIIVIIIQNWLASPANVCPIFLLEFFFFAISKYVGASIEDIQMSIEKIESESPQNLRADLVDMIEFHGKTLE